MEPRKRYPSKSLRERLERAGIAPEDHESRRLRTLLYRRRTLPPIGASADQLARLLLEPAAAPRTTTSASVVEASG